MGAPGPRPPQTVALSGHIMLAVGSVALLILLAPALWRFARHRARPQFSLRRFTLMILAISLAVIGITHWCRALEEERRYAAELEYQQASPLFESPPHEVTISKPFFLARCEITQKAYETVMGCNPSMFKGPQMPVETVSWND